MLAQVSSKLLAPKHIHSLVLQDGCPLLNACLAPQLVCQLLQRIFLLVPLQGENCQRSET